MSDSSIDFSVYLNTLRQKGNLAYEYNPFHNYQTDVDLYIINKTYICPAGLAVNIKNGEILTKKFIKREGDEDVSEWVDRRGRVINNDSVIEARVEEGVEEGVELWAKAGSLIDLDTEQLNFDLNHPVEIEVLPSYDGSVNLILNDDKNIPRLINSRFSVREKDTYEIVDRIGENDTNIYSLNTFNKDTSLYFLYEFNPTITYLGFVKGRLPVGLYCFYFTYCDADENESDFIAESGLIPVFIGNDKDPNSMDGGIKNQETNKGIKLKLSNLDKSYNYLKIYYVRYFADYNLNRVYECKKIFKKTPINSNVLYLQINGYEEAEDLDANILNMTRFNPKNILTQALCKNMLFFANIVKNSDNYRELTDLALRIVPKLNVVKDFDVLDDQYLSNDGAYYNSLNIYNKTGYFNQEYYRFGVVFIYLNGTLSNVYNTLGGTLEEEKNGLDQLDLTGDIYTIDGAVLVRNYIKTDDLGWIKENDKYTLKGSNINAKGVCLFHYTDEYNDKTIFSVKFNVPKEVSKFLKEELGIRGLFFVRQKCVPNILALCYLLGMDKVLEAPVLETGDQNKEHYTECFVHKDSRRIVNDYLSRLFKYGLDSTIDNAISTNTFAGICPDFSLNLPFYNQIFNSGKFRLLKISNGDSYLEQNGRFFNLKSDTKYKINEETKKAIICSVTENVNTVAIKDKVFRLKIGETEEAYRFKYAEIDKGTYNAGEENFNTINEATNIVRGEYSPYLAIYSESGKLETGCLYNIYLDSDISIAQEYLNRMNSSEPFYAISNRYNMIDANTEYECWRGDCYINNYTHRLVRNFNDPSLPNNDKIIDSNTWIDNYDAGNSEKWKDISRSDINAVLIGSWITFKVRSAMNYALRSVDHSYVSEEALMGSPRSFYPRSLLLYRGENKMPDSYLYNDAYRASLGFKCYFTLLDINYIKDTFSNRILYSAIAILDSYKNNYRESYSTYFRDYSQEYGSIQKLVNFEGYLLVIFEHAIGIAVVNERVLAGQGDGEPVFINTNNVLPEELTIITDTYGTLWGESVVKSEAGYVYGVDTIAKKIWRVKGLLLEILSDFKVNEFLINNISLSERELYPIIGLKNVKTHYNNNKKDVLFTFYDDVYKDEEKVWNLCYNELLGQFITFYSWVPSYSANIDTKFFTFDRLTSKCLSLLNKCNYSVLNNTGILLDSPVCKCTYDGNNDITKIDLPYLYYVTPNKAQGYTKLNSDGTTNIVSVEDGSETKNGNYKFNNVKFRIEKDHWGNWLLFDPEEEIHYVYKSDNILMDKITKPGNGVKYTTYIVNNLVPKSNLSEIVSKFKAQGILLLYLTPYIEEPSEGDEPSTIVLLQPEVVALTLEKFVKNPLLTESEKRSVGFTTDFYLHGQAGIFDVAENLYPTYWYGKFHPFEFEFVVNDKIGLLKIFENLVIISNKAEPKSFHFEIEGDNYEFSSDKRTMYFRLEATKNLYLNLGSDILYNRYYTDVIADKYTYELYYRGDGNSPEYIEENISSKRNEYSKYETNERFNWDRAYPVENKGLVKLKKSTIFPLYYERTDTYNDIYHIYLLMHDDDGVYDFENLSGSEISWNRNLNLFNIITHVKNNPIDLVGRLRGNSRYKEGKWNILIPSIIFNLKNEGEWSDKIPPIVINSQYVPKDLTDSEITPEKLPNIYTIDDSINLYVQVSNWSARKETRIRDKWIKIRVRYSGRNLAIIHSIATLYNISYS